MCLFVPKCYQSLVDLVHLVKMQRMHDKSSVSDNLGLEQVEREEYDHTGQDIL